LLELGKFVRVCPHFECPRIVKSKFKFLKSLEVHTYRIWKLKSGKIVKNHFNSFPEHRSGKGLEFLTGYKFAAEVAWQISQGLHAP